MKTTRILAISILSLLLFNTAIASTKDPLDKEINKDNLVLDALSAWREISSLPTALTGSREYRGCFVAGRQNIYQLEEIYRLVGAASMLDLFHSKFIFRVSDQQTVHQSALWLEELLRYPS